MKNISIIGIGKLGLCFALNLERAGYNVLGVDINEDYVDQINERDLISQEPDVEKTLLKAKNLTATTSLKDAVSFSDLLFVLVATPSLSNGKYDHSAINSVINQLKLLGKQKTQKHFIVGCTVMPGYCNSIKERLNTLNYTVNYNPEFIAQGSILHDQLYPDMVLIGEENQNSGNEIEALYHDMCISSPRICRMGLISAEITKIALNCFITTKISFANMVGDIVMKSGGDYKQVLEAIGSDSRVGHKYLRYGYGFGGPCFPRDNRALYIHADDIGYDAKLSKVVDSTNAEHLKFQINEFVSSHPNKDELVIVKGVAYKKDGFIIEESQKLLYAVALADYGYNVKIVDNQYVLDLVEKEYGDLFEYEGC